MHRPDVGGLLKVRFGVPWKMRERALSRTRGRRRETGEPELLTSTKVLTRRHESGDPFTYLVVFICAPELFSRIIIIYAYKHLYRSFGLLYALYVKHGPRCVNSACLHGSFPRPGANYRAHVAMLRRITLELSVSNLSSSRLLKKVLFFLLVRRIVEQLRDVIIRPSLSSTKTMRIVLINSDQ